jgi:uncharacterized NAD(P)/FAD-binding protein YdhS
MHPEDFAHEVRERLVGELEVRHNPKTGYTEVWDMTRGIEDDYVKYLVHECKDRDGHPREPLEADIREIQGKRVADHMVGRRGAGAELAQMYEENERRERLRNERKFDDMVEGILMPALAHHTKQAKLDYTDHTGRLRIVRNGKVFPAVQMPGRVKAQMGRRRRRAAL